MSQQPIRTPDELTVEFDVSGMTCGSCAARVQRTLSRQPGVGDAAVNFATARATVHLKAIRGGPTRAAGSSPDTAAPDTATLVAAVEKLGYGLAPVTTAEDSVTDLDTHERAEARTWLWRVAPAWPLGLLVMALAFAPWHESTPARVAQLLLATPVQFISGWPFLRGAATRLRHRTANMDTLVSLPEG